MVHDVGLVEELAQDAWSPPSKGADLRRTGQSGRHGGLDCLGEFVRVFTHRAELGQRAEAERSASRRRA
jgi:hypothetical protein